MTSHRSQNFLFLFLDGIGLGENNPEINPFARAEMPNLHKALGGHRLVSDSLPNGKLQQNETTLIAIDACLGVKGHPQSATGQTTLITGINIPAKIGYHYGPKPNPEVAAYLKNGTVFSELVKKNISSALLNAYPPSYFQAIESGRRLYSAIPQAVVNAGLQLKTASDLQSQRALAADFTAQGWHTHLKLTSIPQLEPQAAGEQLARLAQTYRFSMFEFWLSDYAGHQQDMEQATRLLETFDRVLGGLFSAWDHDAGMILITSDHGNLEDLRTRRHTENPVPVLLIGHAKARARFTDDLKDLAGITPKILDFLIS
jgi:hypothetical protein